MPPTMIPRSIPVEQIEYSAGAPKSRELPNSVMAGLHLEVNANHDNAASAPTAQDFWRNIIKRLEIVLEGQDDIIKLPFEFLLHLNTLQFKVPPLTLVDLTTSSNVDSYGHFYLPFEFLGSTIPSEGLIDARDMSSIFLTVDWGSPSDLTNITAINSAVLKIGTNEFAEVPRPYFTARHEFAFEEINLDAIGDIEFKLPTKGTNQYWRVWILVLDGSTPRVLSNAEITKLSARSRSFTYCKEPEDKNRANQYKMFGIAALDGVYCIDFTRWGQLVHRVNAMEMSELVLTLTSQVTDGKAIIISEKAIYKETSQA